MRMKGTGEKLSCVLPSKDEDRTTGVSWSSPFRFFYREEEGEEDRERWRLRWWRWCLIITLLLVFCDCCCESPFSALFFLPFPPFTFILFPAFPSALIFSVISFSCLSHSFFFWLRVSLIKSVLGVDREKITCGREWSNVKLCDCEEEIWKWRAHFFFQLSTVPKEIERKSWSAWSLGERVVKVVRDRKNGKTKGSCSYGGNFDIDKGVKRE